MRRQDKIQIRAKKEELRHHQELVEGERGWAGQHGQHPETEEEIGYRPTDPPKDWVKKETDQ